MEIALAYFPVLFSLIFGYYNGWQWTDEQDGVYDPKKAKKRWKSASVALRIVSTALAPVAFSIWGVDLGHLAIAGAISLPVFDMTINRTRGVAWFYLGSTSDTDKWGRWKWLTYAAAIVVTVTLNIILP